MIFMETKTLLYKGSVYNNVSRCITQNRISKSGSKAYWCQEKKNKGVEEEGCLQEK